MSETSQTPTPAGNRQLADMGDEELLGIIERASTDPFAAKEALYLQNQAFERLGKAIQDMLATLTEMEPPSAKMTNAPVSVVQLASAARQRESIGKEKRAFAESLVIGALINRDNPDWDIFDAKDGAAPTGNGLVALLRMTPAAPA